MKKIKSLRPQIVDLIVPFSFLVPGVRRTVSLDIRKQISEKVSFVRAYPRAIIDNLWDDPLVLNGQIKIDLND